MKSKSKKVGILLKGDTVDKDGKMYTKEALEKAVKEFNGSKYYGTNYELVYHHSDECNFCGGKKNEK